MKQIVQFCLFYLVGQLAATTLFAQSSSTIGVRDLHLDPDCADSYARRVLDLVDFNAKYPQLAEAYPDSFPGQIVCFQPLDPTRLREEQAGCEQQALDFYRKISLKSQGSTPYPEEWWLRFNQLYRENHPSCFFFYRKLAPVLSFVLESGLGTGAILDGVQAEVFARTSSQASGSFWRPADADLLIPATGLGLLNCLNKSREGYKPFYASAGSFELRQLLWSETYYSTMPGRVPPRELFLLKLHFSFSLQGSAHIVSTPIFILRL